MGNGETEEVTALGGFFPALGSADQSIDDVVDVAGLRNNAKERGEDLRTGRITSSIVPIRHGVSRIELAGGGAYFGGGGAAALVSLPQICFTPQALRSGTP